MYLIAGLGNPTRQYEHTRHNVGFDVMDALAEKYHISINEKKHKALLGKGVINGQKVILAKPQTYMNLSGESLVELVNYYKLDPESELIVIYDDISFSPGNLRIRESGSAGGHNGVKSIIKCLNTQRFMRIQSRSRRKTKRLGFSRLRIRKIHKRGAGAFRRCHGKSCGSGLLYGKRRSGKSNE